MGILTQEVEIRLWGQNVKYYHDCGYKGKHGDIITVKVKDLQKGSNVSIEYLCDYCKKEVMTMVYADLTRRTKEVNKMACKHCYSQKIKEISILKYGISNYSQTEESKEKRKNTLKLKYGVEHYSKTQEYKEKWNKTCEERYGKYFRKQFTNKAFETFKERTGYDFPTQSPEVREKAVKTYYKNGTTITSKQQMYIYNLYNQNDNSQLNYPISRFNVDICFTEEKIVIEYNGKGHDLITKLGNYTNEEFHSKELIRDKIVKSEGYKLIKIKSNRDKLPSDTILLQMLNESRDYFKQYPNHSWIIYDIDRTLVFNAENKEGKQYEYGELRTIKNEDVENNVA